MATTKPLYYACTIFLLLLLLLLSDHVSPHSEARRLLRRKHKVCKGSCPAQGGRTRDETGEGAFAGLTAGISRRTLLVEDSQAFRPTAPGHSPGVGHSLFDGEGAQKAVSTGGSRTGGSRTLSVDTQDVRPTLPGHSPGVGHLLHQKNADNAQKNADNAGAHTLSPADLQDFRPTMPGHSPGVGHSSKSNGEEESVDKLSAVSEAGRGSLVDTDQDLRPTEPGHSPGVGHSFGNRGN